LPKSSENPGFFYDVVRAIGRRVGAAIIAQVSSPIQSSRVGGGGHRPNQYSAGKGGESFKKT